MNFETLKKGNIIDGDSGNDPTKLPEWMDLERFRRGQQFFQRHIAATCLALHCSLTVLFGVSNIDQALAYTKNSDTAPKALLRYIKTFVHVVVWHLDDVWDEKTQGHKSTQTVRNMHSTVRKAMGLRTPSQYFISQYDLAIVQAGFMAFVGMYPSSFGIKCTKQELEDYVFFWRGIGYLLGIKDQFNLCSGNYSDFYRVGKEIEHEIVYPGIMNPPKHFETLSNAYINGVNSLLNFKLFTRESIIAFTFRISRLPLPNSKLSWTDWLRVLLIRVFLLFIRWVPGFERLFNLLAMWLFGIVILSQLKEFARESETVLANASQSM